MCRLLGLLPASATTGHLPVFPSSSLSPIAGQPFVPGRKFVDIPLTAASSSSTPRLASPHHHAVLDSSLYHHPVATSSSLLTVVSSSSNPCLTTTPYSTPLLARVLIAAAHCRCVSVVSALWPARHLCLNCCFFVPSSILYFCCASLPLFWNEWWLIFNRIQVMENRNDG
ncbi:hypothetical protein PIB30_005074 [Stylosanthes scabra]|uniref:Secreted protein n=1 Tax=Stylosanthes scabra TaxID=79078 RepID=A0ABU6Z1U4_9FABA|nr:hypothetical protein [Stylosanthes scabra]